MSPPAPKVPRQRDYVLVEGVGAFAVLDDRLEEGHVLAWLRYGGGPGDWHKLDTGPAERLVRARRPDLVRHSRLLDARVHAIPLDDIEAHLAARDQPARLAGTATAPRMPVIRQVLQMLSAHGIADSAIGITGSVLLGCQGPDSDLDLVIYGSAAFELARHAIATRIRERPDAALTEAHWRAAWQRRGTSLAFDEYCWHERRKANKLLVDGMRVDVSYLPDRPDTRGLPPARKRGPASVRARVTAASVPFGSPAIYRLEDHRVAMILAPTATFVGQAFPGEQVEARGWLEVEADGRQRLVVGTSREAAGEYLRVVRD